MLCDRWAGDESTPTPSGMYDVCNPVPPRPYCNFLHHDRARGATTGPVFFGGGVVAPKKKHPKKTKNTQYPLRRPTKRAYCSMPGGGSLAMASPLGAASWDDSGGAGTLSIVYGWSSSPESLICSRWTSAACETGLHDCPVLRHGTRLHSESQLELDGAHQVELLVIGHPSPCLLHRLQLQLERK